MNRAPANVNAEMLHQTFAGLSNFQHLQHPNKTTLQAFLRSIASENLSTELP